MNPSNQWAENPSELMNDLATGKKQLASTRSSATTDGWNLSAYQRDTIFRGSNLESPAPQLELRITELYSPFPAKHGDEEKQTSTPLSKTDSDPFSDYASYESDYGDEELEETDKASQTSEHLKKTATKKSQPQLHCTTTFARTPVPQSKNQVQITDRSPLDALCHNLRTPADLPITPSPLSSEPARAVTTCDPGPSRDMQRDRDAGVNIPSVGVARGRGFGPSQVAKPAPTSIVGMTPNFSLPAASQHGVAPACKSEVDSEIPGTVRSIRQWYQSSAPMISCFMAIAAAVCLTVCGQINQTGATMLFRVPAGAFFDLGDNTKHVELYPGSVCLLQGGVSSPR